MKDRILKMMESVTSFQALSKKLNISKANLKDQMNELVKENKVYLDNETGFYYLVKTGTIIMNTKGFGFIKTDTIDEDDYYVPDYELNDIYDGDLVTFYVEKGYHEKPFAKIVKVIKRGHEKIIGQIIIKRVKGDPKYYILSNDNKFNVKARVKIKDLGNAVEGTVVIGTLKYLKNSLEASIDQVLGHIDDPGMDISLIALKYGFEAKFSDDVMAEVDKVNTEVLESELKNRVDFTNKTIITIDGDDSKDFDDAVSLKLLDNGNYELGVYIADVSHYVKFDSELDMEAKKRGTSVYLASTVIPMLPHKLSNGICSLNEDVIRLVLACTMEIDLKGNLKSYDIKEGYIKSKHRMTYNKVNQILKGNTTLIEEYNDIYDMILKMNDLAHIIRRRREKKGGIEFEVAEYKIDLNTDGSPKEIKIRTRGDAEMLIEDFMLQANETVSYHLSIMELPCVYRVHEKPDQEKLRNVFTLLSNLGYTNKVSQNDIHPKVIQEALKSIEDETNSFIANQMLLRAMMKAKYTTQNLGHYGLSMQYYSHFTSPIRRYPDLILHRIIKECLLHPTKLNQRLNYYNENLELICVSNSISERKAIECEREVNDMLFAWYMQSHINETYEGMISSVLSFGMFVSLNNGVEGLIHIRNLDGYFVFDEKNLTLTNGTKTYKLGDKIKIVVTASNRNTRQIDFLLEEDYNKLYGVN